MINVPDLKSVKALLNCKSKSVFMISSNSYSFQTSSSNILSSYAFISQTPYIQLTDATIITSFLFIRLSVAA